MRPIASRPSTTVWFDAADMGSPALSALGVSSRTVSFTRKYWVGNMNCCSPSLLDLAPTSQFSFLIEGQAQVFSVRRRRNGSAHANPSRGVGPVDSLPKAEPKGNLGAAFEDPIGGLSLVRFTDGIGLSQFGDGLIVGVGADPAVPIRIGVQLGTAGAARERQRQHHQNDSTRVHLCSCPVIAPRSICESISAKGPQTRPRPSRRGVRNKCPNPPLAAGHRNHNEPRPSRHPPKAWPSIHPFPSAPPPFPNPHVPRQQ